MGRELGRISGPLLSANLLRRGKVESGTENLAFHNNSIDDNFLYIDVINDSIGVSSTSTSNNELNVNGTVKTTNLITDTRLTLDNDLAFYSNKIEYIGGSIIIAPNPSLDPTVTTTRIGTANLRISDKLIENITTDSNIELSPNGTGRVIFNTSRVNVTGDLHATGNITWDGNITFGNAGDESDTVTFKSEISSNLIPDADITYDLGSNTDRWSKLYSTNLTVENITAYSELTTNNINLVLPTANTIYVSVNGSDTNYGNHTQSTFRTVKHALSQAVTGTEIVIFPGTYNEEFPLTIPQGVSVRGTSIRSVIIKPTVGTNTNDAFLLNGETTVSFLTIQDFYQGYAFRFAPGMLVTTRSPYVFNVTVITRGSVTSLSDPLGFDQGDAGGGAYLDGNVVSSASKDANGLFYSVTFIVPNADGMVATNGVRVEWLNCFTYYAHRGIYLISEVLDSIDGGTSDTTGAELEGGSSTSPITASITGGDATADIRTENVCEIRSINSASVYGTYGAVADGANTLGYLIGHNFGYIGSGSNSQNDNSIVIQANEIVEINSGQLYYDSMDHKGDYRIGDIFYVSQETGRVILDAQAIDFTSGGSIVLESPSSTTIIDAFAIQTGNIRVYDNNIDSLFGPVNILASSGITNLNTNVTVTGTLNVTGGAVVKGNVFLGDNPFDTVNVFPRLTQTIKPATNNFYTLGNNDLIDPKNWDTAFITGLVIDGTVDARSNTFTTLTTNTDLELVAAGTGNITVLTTDVQIDNDLTVDNILTINGASNFQPVEITGTLLLTGEFDQTGNTYITGLFANNNISILNSSSYLEVPNIKIQNNVINATETDSDLVFSATGASGVILDNKLKITDNIISNVWTSATTNTQKSIILTPNGPGNTLINSVTALAVPYGNDTNRTLSQIGEIRQNSTTKLYEGWTPNGLVSFNDLYDSDRNTYITAELTPYTNDNILRFVITGSTKAEITSSRLFDNTLHVDNVRVSGNTINNLVTSNDLELLPTGTGSVNINNIPFKENNITNLENTAFVLGSTGGGYIKFAGTGAVVFPIGTTEERRPTIDCELGEFRYNTSFGYMEVFDGTTWIPSAGTSLAASQAEIIDIMDEWTLILG